MIIIVSGLPRSGTSMMMRMLDKAGIPMLTDKIRESDEDNILGYYEYEPVKKLLDDNSWIKEAEGKVVKIVSPLLKTISSENEYKIIFMERKIEEVLLSQQKMIERRKENQPIKDEQMKKLYRSHLDEIKTWLDKQPHCDTLYVDYNKTLEDPLLWAQKVEIFLNLQNVAKVMAQVVKPEFYRQRK